MLKFSQKLKYSGCIRFSPDDEFFAVSKGSNLVIYNTNSFLRVIGFPLCDLIENIEWSPNSKLILACLSKRGIVEIRSIEKGKEKSYCKIDEGVIGLNNAIFSPDSLHVLTFSQYNIKLSIRSLVDKSTLYISLPKFSKKGISFTKKGNFMALAERKEAKDVIGIYFLGNWTSVAKFETETEDLQDVQWTYDNSALLIPDTPCLCRLYIYNPVGELIKKIDLYKNKLGLRNLYISPNGHYICMALYDQSVRIYNSISYTNITDFFLNEEKLKDNKVNYFKEEIRESEKNPGFMISVYPKIEPEIDISSYNKLPNANAILPDSRIKMGISQVMFSSDSKYMAVKNENMSKILFIYNLTNMCLHTVIIQLNEITDFKWAENNENNKNNNILFISCNNNKLYYFILKSLKVAELEQDFQNNKILLSKNGKKMILKDPNYYVIVNIDGDLIGPNKEKENFNVFDTKSSQNIFNYPNNLGQEEREYVQNVDENNNNIINEEEKKEEIPYYQSENNYRLEEDQVIPGNNIEEIKKE